MIHVIDFIKEEIAEDFKNKMKPEQVFSNH